MDDIGLLEGMLRRDGVGDEVGVGCLFDGVLEEGGGVFSRFAWVCGEGFFVLALFRVVGCEA